MRTDLVKGKFTPLGRQLEKMRRWSQLYGWGITSVQFDKAVRSKPEWPEGRLVAVSLVAYLHPARGKSSLQRSFDAYSTVIARKRAFAGRDSLLGGGEHRLRLIDGIKIEPCLRWVVIDLEANCNQAPLDVRDPNTSPHIEMFATVALHTHWANRLGKRGIPHVHFSGLQVNARCTGDWQGVPSAVGLPNIGRYQLNVEWEQTVLPGYAVPVLVKS
ncbi:MAG: hypothetical protein ABII13_03215 [Patescibacteria group bacterium]|nr:hypothetical protein [Patescibacteria group bacterium]